MPPRPPVRYKNWTIFLTEQEWMNSDKFGMFKLSVFFWHSETLKIQFLLHPKGDLLEDLFGVIKNRLTRFRISPTSKHNQKKVFFRLSLEDFISMN